VDGSRGRLLRVWERLAYVSNRQSIQSTPRGDGIGNRMDLNTDSRNEISQLTLQIAQSGLALLPLMGGMLITSLIVHFAQVGVLAPRQDRR
jgi:hypothetical protein